MPDVTNPFDTVVQVDLATANPRRPDPGLAGWLRYASAALTSPSPGEVHAASLALHHDALTHHPRIILDYPEAEALIRRYLEEGRAFSVVVP